MKTQAITTVALASLAAALIGDNLDEFKFCVSRCQLLMLCDTRDVMKTIHDNRIQQMMEGGNEQRAPKEPELKERKELYTYTRTFFEELFRQHPLFEHWWLCAADCNYKCQQIVTHWRLEQGLPMVKFYGKWPFLRKLGMQEVFSAVFSFANFYSNWQALRPMVRQVQKNLRAHMDPAYARILFQFLLLIIGLMVGWIFSTIFHIRDFPLTETLDYYGAFAIILLNFNAIGYRFLGIYDRPRAVRVGWAAVLVLVYVGHCIKLYNFWDYGYNTKINLVFGLSALVMWIAHSLRVRLVFRENYMVYSNLLQLVPFETRILNKLNYIKAANPLIVPLIPIFCNIVMALGLSFELRDFAPIGQLVDAHALWHLFTIWPPLIWYDWNVWDVELLKLRRSEKLV